MKSPLRKILLLCFSLALLFNFSSNKNYEEIGLNNISEKTLRAHVSFLSDDLLEGRGTGQRGMQIASRYLAAQFELQGFEPGGDNGTYYQEFPMFTSKILSGTSLSIEKGSVKHSFSFGSDFIIQSEFKEDHVFSAELIFGGYGIDEENLGWNDYKNIDVTDKIVILLGGVPPQSQFQSREARRLAGISGKFNMAKEKGAAGVFIIADSRKVSIPWQRIQAIGSRERASLATDDEQRTAAQGFLTTETANRLLASAGFKYSQLVNESDQSGFSAKPLNLVMKVDIKTDSKHFVEKNVVGLIRGKIEGEYIIISAHHDAYGIRAPINGDNIYNGAVDNATGTAALIEVGKAFNNLPEKPNRSIILIAVAAEEYGLLGSKYYARNPIYPANKTLANVNFDELLDHGKMIDVSIIGKTRTTLGVIAEKIAGESGLKVAESNNLTANAFFLSDQLSFAEVGIPAIYLYAGNEHEGRSKEWTAQQLSSYYANEIHKPFDHYEEDWKMEGIMQIVRMGFQIAYRASNLTEWPTWYDGQPYKEIREESLKGN